MADNKHLSDELIKRIESDIQKTGFPLEVYVLNVCSTKNTGRMPSVKYEYQKELREIDLFSFFESIRLHSKAKGYPQHTKTDLIIECKKSEEKPWVFFSTPAYAFEDVRCFLKYASDFDRYFSTMQRVGLLPQIYSRIGGSHYADPLLPRCIAYYEAFKDPSRPSEIYRAIDSVITYLSYRLEHRSKLLKEFGVFSEFFLPIIVLDGRLFEASVDKSQVEIRERSHLQLRTFHREDVFIIDVVTKDRFQQFFDQVGRFHEELVSAIALLKLPTEFRVAARARVKDRSVSTEIKGRIMMASKRAKRRGATLDNAAPTQTPQIAAEE